MAHAMYVGRACTRLLTTPFEGQSPMSLLRSEKGLEYNGTLTEILVEAQRGCRLCRILKDFMHETKNRSRVQRHRLQSVTDASHTPHPDEKVRLSLHLSKNRLTISAPNNVFASTIQFRPTTNPGDPAAKFLPHTTTTLNRGSRQTFDSIRAWITECRCEHSKCINIETTLPGRLIDLSNFSQSVQELRLYSPTEGERGRYVALSYCWGYSQPVVTTLSNLSDHMRRFSYHSLPQTLQDAIKTTKALGVRFLWVDALCIIQDSGPDKETEIGKMAQTFQNAYFTIVAACATSSAEGFLQLRDGLPPALEVPVLCDNGQVGTLSLMPTYEGLRHEPLHERAWTLQEIILSRRLLIFGKDSVGWKCFEADHGVNRWTDWNGYCASAGLTTIRFGPNGEISRPALSCYSADFATYRASRLAERQPLHFRLWRDVARDYSTRSMTNEEDKLDAISGIVTYFQSVMNDVYLAGLWKKHLLYELCWKVHNAKRPSIWRAPSWSWMALDGPVVFQTDHCEWYTPIVQVWSCTARPMAANAPFSRVTEGTLTLWGPLGSISHGQPSMMDSSGLSADQIRMGNFEGAVLDCAQEWNEQYHYLGLAECVMATYDGHQDGPKLTWGLILREVNGSSTVSTTFERVGWFNSSYWEPSKNNTLVLK